MAFDLARLETIIVVIMENRSFDQILGYRGLPAYGGRDVDGIQLDDAWVRRFTNYCEGKPYVPFHYTGLTMSGDPPHERGDMAVQIGAPYPWAGAGAPMNGFVMNYAANQRVPAGAYAEVMGYYTPAEEPVADFLANNFVLCDRWFCALPASTQPNRLMAMGGFSNIDNSFSDTVPDQDLVYDWCDRQQTPVRWRVYHEGWPFFMVMPRWRLKILADAALEKQFRWLDRFEKDFCAPDPFPQLVFIEPKYTDDHFSTPAPSDDHPPSSIAGGEAFFRRIYSALLKNSERWNRSVMIITFDENGGLFDHVSPLAVPTPIASQAGFATTGIRVPALVVSPLVGKGQVFHGELDHTSILRLIGEKFGDNGLYSPAVNDRPRVASVKDALDAFGIAQPRRDCLPPPNDAPANSPVNSNNTAGAPSDRIMTPTARAFEHALLAIRREQPNEGAAKFPELGAFLRDPLGLWRLAQDELRAKGFALDSDCHCLLRNFVEQGEVRLLKEPGRQRVAQANLTQFLNTMVSQAPPTGRRTLRADSFLAAKEACRLWPFS